MIGQLSMSARDLPLLGALTDTVEMIVGLPFEVDLWQAQNTYHKLLANAPAAYRTGNWDSKRSAQTWLDRFATLGEKLGVRVVEQRERSMQLAATVLAKAQEVAGRRRVPSATYRLQLNRTFTFEDAQSLVPYLRDLGISDCYASPLFRARAGSSHGYDVCDYSQLNPELGGEEGFEHFTTALRAHDLGLLLDMVPNHMAIGDAANSWWLDVLENGPSSVHASFFDIDWHPTKPELKDKVLLPVLGDQYGKVLESGQFRLSFEEGAFYLHYYDIKLPVAPRTYSRILRYQIDTLAQALGEHNEHLREFRSILTALSYLPPRSELSAEKIAERYREKEVIKARLGALLRANAYIRAAIEMALQAFNGTAGSPRSFDLLDKLLDDQAYRPAFWRVAAEEINYRRFFDINELAAIRVERPEVFRATHQLVLRLLAEGKVSGLRIDHPDGLWNPQCYFRLLQESYLFEGVRARIAAEDTPDDVKTALQVWLANRWGDDGPRPDSLPLYVVVEKILAAGESLPEDWAVDGTTGYDFLNAVNGMFVAARNARSFDQIYGRFIGGEVDFQNLTNGTRKMIMLVSLAGEIQALSHQLERIAEKNRLYRDFTLNSLTFAIREVIAALPVYRTYVTGPGSVGRQDESYIEAAVAEAKKHNPRTAAAVFDFIRDTLLLRNVADFSEDHRQNLVDLVMKFQQVTGPVMAKGVEDTAFYVYNRLVSLNEVGGHPERFGTTMEEFHRQNVARLHRWPHALLATSTHDTKRSEDVRARISVLSELPEEWGEALARWSKLNAPLKTALNGEFAPDRNDEYLLYQTLLGTRPDGPLTGEEQEAYRERIEAYMHKATKEAKVHTSWVNPNEEYDGAVQDFVRRLLSARDGDPFHDDFLALQRRVAYFGRYNALSQVLLKLTSPGVPDIYQGAELWDYSLVDPDNRRPVDYARRRDLLAGLQSRICGADRQLATLAHELLESAADGRIKLFLTALALHFRRAHIGLFASGGYLPLAVRGEKHEHVCAFARVFGEDAAIVVAPRLVVQLTAGVEQPPLGAVVWKDTRLILPQEVPGGIYRNIFTGEVLSPTGSGAQRNLRLAAICGAFPVALLERLAEP